MVRTFLCHPYTEATAFTDQFDIVTFCYTPDDRIIISSVEETIHIHNLKHNGCPKLHKFSSLGVAVKMVYSDNKHLLVTMEARLNEYKKNALPNDLNCQARVYVNFSKLNLLKPQYVVNGYLNNLNLPHSSATYLNYMNKLLTIDINVRHPIIDIAVCRVKDNIALASKRKIYIYGYKEITFDSDSGCFKLMDFVRLIEIAPSFHLQHLSLFGNWLTFSSKTEIRIVQMFVSEPEDENICQAEDVSELLDSATDAEDSSNPSKTLKENFIVNDTIGLDENFVVWNFNPANQDNFAQSLSKPTQRNVTNFETVKAESLYIDRSTTSKEIQGPCETINGHPLRCSFNSTHSTGDKIICVTLLYRRFDPDDLSILGENHSLHSLQFLPIFAESPLQQTEDKSKEWPWNLFQLPATPKLVSLALFFSSGRQGFLYDINGSLKEPVTYDYTSDCFGAIHSSSLLYTYTKNGLEIYTSRLYTIAAKQWTENFKDLDIQNKEYDSFPSLEQYHKKNRTDTELFTELNYFGSYVTISKEEADLNYENESSEHSPFTSLTVYSPNLLAETCPPYDIDPCLIGIYHLQQICWIGASTSFIILLVKAFKREKQGTSYTTPWSIYKLEKTDPQDFFEELMKLVSGNEFTSPTVYYQILSEAYLFLASKLVSGSSYKEDLNKLLKTSAIKIADFLARADDTFDWKQLSSYYSMASLSFENVLQRFMEANVPDEKKFAFSSGMIEYLKSYLFSSTIKVETLNNAQSEFILIVFFKNLPILLSTVLLKSKILCYEDEAAIKFMNEWEKIQESKNNLITTVDYLCLAYLNMKLGNPANAEKLLKTVSLNALSKICIEYKDLLFTEAYLITPFGQLIKKRLHSLFISILISLFDLGEIKIKNILDFYKKFDQKDDCFSYKVCQVLETLLQDNGQKKSFFKIAVVLVEQYIFHSTQGASTDGWKTNHSHLPKSNGHFGDRFSWLNKMHPFQGEFPTPQQCVKRKTKKKQTENANRLKTSSSLQKISPSFNNSPTNTPPAASPPSLIEFDNKFKQRSSCSCCCCNEILLKFQALLSSRYNRKEFSIHVINRLLSESFIGRDTLLLLCWPKSGDAKEAVDFIVENHPTLTLQYAKDMFDWKAQWQLLLQNLLHVLKANNYERWSQSDYTTCLKGVLLRLSRAFEPLEFLSFLPSDGNMQFFLPFIQECWEYNQANVIKQQFIDTYKDNIINED